MAKKTPRKPAARTVKRPAKKKVQAVPAAYGSVTAHLVQRDCVKAIAFYQKAFGARLLSRMAGPGGMTMHAEIRIGDTVVMLGDEAPAMGSRSAETLGGSPVGLMLYVKDCDATFQKAVALGAKPLSPPADMFWGDRFSSIQDPFGHSWSIATHTVDLTRKQMEKAAAAFTAQMAAGGPPQG